MRHLNWNVERYHQTAKVIVLAQKLKNYHQLSYSDRGNVLPAQFKYVVLHGRQLILLNFNNVVEMTGGDMDMFRQLQHIDGLEFYPGVMLAKSYPTVTPFKVVKMGKSYAVKGMMANP